MLVSTQVPVDFQPRALTWGIIGAVAMRGVMILVGVTAIQKFRWIVLLFSGILLASSAKLLFGHEESDEDLSENFFLKLIGKFIPATEHYDRDNFFTKVRMETG